MSLADNGGGRGELLEIEAPARVPLPDAAALAQELAEPYELTPSRSPSSPSGAT